MTTKTSADKVIEAIAVTAELTQTTLSGVAMATMAQDLMTEFPVPAILQALDRCRKEIKARLTLPEVRERIEAADGRPGANEAWGIALSAFDESATVVTNDEINEAMAAARPVMQSGDDIGARMAFRDSYERVVRKARLNGIKSPKWYPSLGTDQHQRVVAIQLAESRGLLTHQQATAYLPAPISPEDQVRGNAIAGLLTGTVTDIPKDPEFKAKISQVLSILKKDKAA